MKYNSLDRKPISTPKNLKSSRTIESISNDLSNLNDYNNARNQMAENYN